MRHRFHAHLSALAAASSILVSGPAKAADPTTADCLAASDASLRSGNEHKLRAERSQLLVCAAASCPADIRRECIRRVDEVNAAIPTLIFAAEDADGRDLTAVKVTMDGELLAERLEGTALSIDPGQHDFVFETAGQPRLTGQYVIREGQKDRRESIKFGVGTTAESPRAASPLPLPAAPASEDDANQGLGTQRIVAIFAAGAGVVGVGVGGALGMLAVSKKNDAEKVCPGQCADQNGVDLWSDAKSAGNTSTVLFIAGGAAIAGAVVLWLTGSPSAAASATQVGIGPRSVEWKGTW